MNSDLINSKKATYENGIEDIIELSKYNDEVLFVYFNEFGAWEVYRCYDINGESRDDFSMSTTQHYNYSDRGEWNTLGGEYIVYENSVYESESAHNKLNSLFCREFKFNHIDRETYESLISL
jgi:hypothetical protein